MLDFIYDSLETVKKLKFPTVKQFAQLTGAIFWLVIVAWLYFILCDTIFLYVYKMFYASMTGWEEAVEDIEAVSAEDSGYLGSAAADIKAMNQWFFQGGRWFYLSAGLDWLYHLTPQLRAGPVLKANIPLGGIITDKSAQGMLYSVRIKICR